jgi:hypothetical protein
MNFPNIISLKNTRTIKENKTREYTQIQVIGFALGRDASCIQIKGAPTKI